MKKTKVKENKRKERGRIRKLHAAAAREEEKRKRRKKKKERKKKRKGEEEMLLLRLSSCQSHASFIFSF